jgi:hypothetical protein
MRQPLSEHEYGGFVLGVRVGIVVHLCKVLWDETFLVVLTSRLSVALMMKLDNEMNYNVDHLTMFSMLLSNELIHFKNRNMSHEHVILLMNAMLVYKGTNA